MTRLADLMDEHKEELATLEAVDSGAVYTLALKTHVGFSVDTFRYFAGWCDKIQVRKEGGEGGGGRGRGGGEGRVGETGEEKCWKEDE